ncbi:hypothetical protein [Orenia marismortui]|uniref:hypothetical protein n=1 Tax=Orenia marismortui TaxID=46469 RepID=UPI0003743A52|nr:hypothetical protein [Orenia marismortui]
MLRTNKLFSKAMIFTLILTFSVVFMMPQGVLAAEKIRLSSGTPVLLQLNDTLTADTVNMGDEVALTVVQDVVVDGKVVIKAGSTAFATITAAEDNGFLGKAGKMGLKVNSVTTVDGTSVALSGTRFIQGEDKSTMSVVVGVFICAPFLLMKGEEAVIPANTTIQSRISGTYTITVK